MINTCNELNAGYAAEGYARARGIGCVVVTFTVGGLSVINAVAGAYSENLPLLCIAGGPNSNDFGTNRILHHTIGEANFTQEEHCFKQVTCKQVVINDLDDAHEKVDDAISTAMRLSKPVYISICCNLAGLPHPSFEPDPIPYWISYKESNPRSRDAAVEAAAEMLNKATKPVLVGGVKLRMAKAEAAFADLARACEYPVAIMPNAKGMVSEHLDHFIGTYWGPVSTEFCAEMVESADAYVFAGPIFNDYSSTGYSLLINKPHLIQVEPYTVRIGDGRVFNCVAMKDFLTGLAKAIKPNPTAWDNYERMYQAPGQVPPSKPNSPLRTNVLFKHIQAMLTSDSAIVSETGDSWFNCQKLKLPEGCGYEFQMQYGSIGWSVGALLGYATALQNKKRVIACIGDGSFQVTAQDISTVIRYDLNPIVFLINNAGYTIEVEIHDGPYNNIKNWDYAGLIHAFSNGEGNAWATKVTTEEELTEALKHATEEHTDGLCFIECIIHRDDCSKELLEWGSRVATANSRKPNPQ
ncbi:hypothetical protein WJX72_000539 [[Myrmecia] bisecta]|uniref:pyruvate decarboxylase n=1 Tax=[Myrmecia] bisecta TaxID=41462 RepID=A0AAW1Q3N8_9CHLO